MRSDRLLVLVAAWLTVGLARSPSHDTAPLASNPAPEGAGFAAPQLPRPMAGLERIRRQRGGSVCRTGHGALPCAGGRSLSKERGRPLSPFMSARRGLEPSHSAGVGARGARDWNAQRGSTLSPSQAFVPPPRKRELTTSPVAVGLPTQRAARSRGSRVRTDMSATASSSKGYQILGENVLWESPFGAMTIYERVVRFPDDEPGSGNPGGGDDDGGADTTPALSSLNDLSEVKTVKWHIVGCPLGNFSSVVIFPFDSRTGSCSLIREYCPGVHAIKSGIPGGLFEERKHQNLLDAARHELNEEAGLKGGTWIALAPEGVPQDKYSRNRLHPYLVIDATVDPNPRSQDETEQIQVEHGVSLREARRRLLAGDMPAPAAMVTLMALEKLRELGYAA